MGPLATARQPKKAASELLREVRTALGVSQDELAARAGTTQSAVSRIEAGRVSPSFETLRELLRLLGADLSIEVSARDAGVDFGQIEENFKIPATRRVAKGIGWAEEIARLKRELGAPAGEGGVPASAFRRVNEEGKEILRLGPLLAVLDRHRVDFVVIGGVAGLSYGSAYPTYDLDIAYSREGGNLERLTAALREIGVSLRGAPPELPFQLDAKTLEAGMNFTFESDMGDFDILGHIDGIASYEDLRARAKVDELSGIKLRVASLDHLIRMKRTIDRTKDQLMVEEYVTIDRLRREWQARHRD